MYYIIEHQVRPDGMVNVLSEVARSTRNTALSYYFDRCSKMSATELFKSVHIMLVDDMLNVIEKRDIETAYRESGDGR